MLIVGAGAVGLEMGTIYQRLGSEVSILEIMSAILPGSDREIVTRMERILKLQGLRFGSTKATCVTYGLKTLLLV